MCISIHLQINDAPKSPGVANLVLVRHYLHMNEHPSDSDTPIEQFLSTVATFDLRDGYVAPKEEASRRIEAEISRRCGSTPALLATDHAMGRTHELDHTVVSAKPDVFVTETLSEIQRISEALSQHHAKRFEITFQNKSGEPNLWGDRIFVGVRYMT